EIKEALTFKKKSQDVYDKSMAFMKYNVMVNILIDVMISMVIFAILIYGAYLIANTQMSSGTLTTYIGYFFTLLWPVFAISWFLMVNGQAQASAKRIYKFLESPIDVKDANDAIVDAKLDGSITVKNLTLRYPDAEEPMLKDISFNIKSGEMVGILGKKGSG